MKKRVKEVLNGVDRISNAASLFRGNRLGLLTNASGVNKKGIPTYELLSEKYDLKVLFAPEHGIFSNLQDGLGIENSKDAQTGADIVNLYHPDEDSVNGALDKIDVVVYDIQDVGARYYTYLYNLSYVMRKCASSGKSLVVLDRINPIGGVGIEGPVLDTKRFSSGIGEFAIPIRYGLTVGEFAKYINAEENIGCKLEVIPCAGWDRRIYADDTDLLWVNPSPNMPSVSTAINYIATCVFEATNISEGRGTTSPFNIIGAPFVDAKRLCDTMTSHKLPGVVFRRATFTPKFGKYENEVCYGVELHITNRAEYSPFETSLYLYRELGYYREFEARENAVCLRIGNECLVGEYVDPDAIMTQTAKELREYHKKAAKYLMY